MSKSGWHFDNSYLQLPNHFYHQNPLNPVEDPQLVYLNMTLAQNLGLNAVQLQKEAAVFAGNEMPDGAAQIAQSYAGHQFGYFNMLGDGRALLIGEQLTPMGERFDIQLKGSGRTAYSRRGDGRAALGPMLREVIISEAMAGLNIPTTKSLAVAVTGEAIQREQPLPGAVLTRVASSHIRVATFQYAANFGTTEDIKALADYTIQRHYPHLTELGNPYVGLLDEVMEKQAELVAKWQLVGFVHGVLNTDNVSICGESIDFGPCAFMNEYNPQTVFSSIDKKGRYAYGNQPQVTMWNLTRFAESLLPILADNQQQAIELAENTLKHYPGYFQSYWMAGMREKLGLIETVSEDRQLVEQLLQLMEEHKADYTATFRALSDNTRPQTIALFKTEGFLQWEQLWQARLTHEGTSFEHALISMQAVNPAVIARNHLVEEALDYADLGDLQKFNKLVHALANPFEVTENNKYLTLLPEDDEPYITYCGT